MTAGLWKVSEATNGAMVTRSVIAAIALRNLGGYPGLYLLAAGLAILGGWLVLILVLTGFSDIFDVPELPPNRKRAELAQRAIAAGIVRSSDQAE